MEMVGNVANVVSLVEVAIKLAKQLGIFIKDMRDAPRDMRDIDLDLRSTHFQLLQIKEALQTPGEAGVLGSHEHRKEFRCLLEELKSLFDDLLELMQEHDSIDSPYLRRAKWANVGKMKAELLRKRLKRQKFALLLTLQWSHGHSVSATHRSLLHRQNEQQNQIRFITEQLRRQSDREDISTDEVHTQSWLGILSTLATVSALPRKDPRRAYQSSASSSATNLSNSVTTIGSETSSTTSRPVPPTSGHIFDTLLCDIESIIIAQQTAAPEDFRGLHGVEICSTIMQGLCVGDDLFGSDNAGKERYRSLLFDLLHPQGGSAQFLDQNVSARRIVLGSLDGAEDHVASINSGVADDTYWDDENIHLPDINPPPYSRELALYEDEAQSRLPAINPLPARCAALRHSNMPALSPGSKRKILWIPLLPALYSCVEYVKQTTTGYDAMLFEEVTIKSFCYDASSTLHYAI